ncbi:MAG TPA: ATP-binding protein [Bryobacteraceae bacterium]|nr:ATP-binding protein [Bryobacteraceae bacterium]
MPRRLAQKLVVSLTLIVVVIGAVSGLVTVKTEQQHLLDAIITGADQLSKSITSATWHAMLDDHREAAYQVMQTIGQKQGVERIRMFNRTGRLMFSTAPDETAASAATQSDTCTGCHDRVPPREKLSASGRVRIFTARDGRRNLAMVTPIFNEAACSQAACHAHPASVRVLGVLDLGLNLDAADREISQVKLGIFAVTGIEIFLISMFIFYFTRRFVAEPIQQLIAGTKAVSAMDLDKPIDIIHSSEELDDLARSFNVMRERLGLAMDEINQFTARLETKVAERTEELRSAHQKLRQTDRLASLGQLAASVAHEINNPISGVLNLSMLMQRILKDDGVPQERVPEFRKYLGQVVKETSRVGRIVSDLLSFSRRSKPQRADADLNRIVKTTLSLVSHKLQLGNVPVDLDLAENLPAVHCDTSQIQQVVLNLVLNGAEATHGRETRRLALRTRPAAGGTAVLLSVEDNGEGVKPENLARIFDPFFTTKPEGKGVGLGLAVSYGIIQAHGGDIAVTSRPGGGATFTVTLPISGNPEEPALVGAGAERA